ncbi:LysR family transcriptional regulator [Hydrogenophaga palleronii]|uniref:LysR family transcriptional regulator n=1 Tax=Hydrogenophaga palleronii TaxID=65655 RepID=UPI0008251E93|nr:LysR family transcriptional regulator [Hydrogenophaga palleronii]
MSTTSSVFLNRLLARGKFRHVQVLLHLTELGSVQRTADAIGMTQSSVTQTLAYLEELLGIKLFDRHARGVRPTPACQDLLPVARQLMLGLSEGAEVLAARQQQGVGTIRLIGSASAINGLLLNALPAFGELHPGIQIHLREAEDEDQLLAIARGEVDLVACRRPSVVPEGWEFHPVLEDHLLVVCRANHPVARLRKPSWSTLSKQTWFVSPAGLTARTHFDALCKPLAKAPKTYTVVTRSMPMLWQLLLHRDLLALLPLTLVRPLLETGALVSVPLAENVAMPPIGLLQPRAGMGVAASSLSQFIHHRSSADSPKAARPSRKPRR